MKANQRLRRQWIGAVVPQASPAPREIKLSDYLPEGKAGDQVDRFIRKMEPITIVNPHIWDQAQKNLSPEMSHYAVRLMGLLAYEYEVEGFDKDIEKIFDAANRRAIQHFTMDTGVCAEIAQSVVMPCFGRSGRFTFGDERKACLATVVRGETRRWG